MPDAAFGVAIAALILAVLSFLMVIPLCIVFVAKHYFSEHIIQRVPVDAFTGETFASGMQTSDVQSNDKGSGPDPFMLVGDPLSKDEEAYFAAMAEKRKKSEAV